MLISFDNAAAQISDQIFGPHCSNKATNSVFYWPTAYYLSDYMICMTDFIYHALMFLDKRWDQIVKILLKYQGCKAFTIIIKYGKFVFIKNVFFRE